MKYKTNYLQDSFGRLNLLEVTENWGSLIKKKLPMVDFFLKFHFNEFFKFNHRHFPWIKTRSFQLLQEKSAYPNESFFFYISYFYFRSMKRKWKEITNEPPTIVDGVGWKTIPLAIFALQASYIEFTTKGRHVIQTGYCWMLTYPYIIFSFYNDYIFLCFYLIVWFY